MKERIMLAEQIVSSRFKKDNIYYPLYVLSCYGLLTKFEDYTEIIKNLFETCEFYVTNSSLEQLFEKYKSDFFSYDYDENFGEVVGLSDIGKDYYLDDYKIITYNYSNPRIFCSTKNGNTELINSLIHELSHLIKSSIKHFYRDIDGEIIQRCGLYKLIEFDSFNLSVNSSLDEVINVLQVTDMLKEIKNIDTELLSDDVKDFLNSLDLEKLDEPVGYEVGVMLLSPLWDNDYFKDLVESNIIIGNLDTIEECFDSVLGIDNTFLYFSESFDMIMDSENNEDEILEHGTYIESIINLFNIKTTNQKVLKKEA